MGPDQHALSPNQGESAWVSGKMVQGFGMAKRIVALILIVFWGRGCLALGVWGFGVGQVRIASFRLAGV